MTRGRGRRSPSAPRRGCAGSRPARCATRAARACARSSPCAPAPTTRDREEIERALAELGSAERVRRRREHDAPRRRGGRPQPARGRGRGAHRPGAACAAAARSPTPTSAPTSTSSGCRSTRPRTTATARRSSGSSSTTASAARSSSRRSSSTCATAAASPTTARALYIHPNTLRQRMDRIEKLAGPRPRRRGPALARARREARAAAVGGARREVVPARPAPPSAAGQSRSVSSGNGGRANGRTAMRMSASGLSSPATRFTLHGRAAAAAVDERPLAVLAHVDGDRLHGARARRGAVAGDDRVEVQAPQARRAVVSVVGARRVARDVEPAVPAAERIRRRAPGTAALIARQPDLRRGDCRNGRRASREGPG